MSSGFITETEIADIRKRRQEEWEKVRTAEDPLERPDEPIDNRSLFERLQEQKQKKDLEYEEAHKLKNMIKGLDDDEIEFLDLVDRTKLAADRKKELEEERELNDYRNRVASLQEAVYEKRLKAEIIIVNKPKAPPTNKLNSQQAKLLKGAFVKKMEPHNNKRKLPNEEEDNNSNNDHNKIPKLNEAGDKLMTAPSTGDDEDVEQKIDDGPAVIDLIPNSSLKCVAILPGLGCYSASSSDECSTDSELECYKPKKLDICGRKIEKPQKES